MESAPEERHAVFAAGDDRIPAVEKLEQPHPGAFQTRPVDDRNAGDLCGLRGIGRNAGHPGEERDVLRLGIGEH
jgi:hypothetical protein